MLPFSVEGGMKAHAEGGYPNEVCGYLGGLRQGAERRALEAWPVPNLNRERARDRYLMDPREQLRLEREARQRGLEIVGAYHSHPDNPSRPSETDRSRAAEIWGLAESWSYVILEVAGGELVSWRSWVLQGGQFGEEERRVVP